jgi:hypothetical protein
LATAEEGQPVRKRTWNNDLRVRRGSEKLLDRVGVEMIFVLMGDQDPIRA